MSIKSQEPIHEWFGLTYASYYVMPRSVLQAMPIEWQEKFVELITQIPETLNLNNYNDNYTVLNRKGNKFVKDPYSNYKYPIKINKK